MKVLYICTHNRCRSILSEAITNHVAGDVITAKSAGSQPAGEVHPLSLKYLNEAGIPTEGLQSQSWDEFEAFAPDLVITVCDSAAGESCPVWFGKSVKVHWGLSDPSKLTGSEEDIARAFNDTITQIS
ncbi:MAG: arsenate reductase ArsC, partial [Pseudomonadota bacterium]|nr:arsenate reductase ArsC [Pseudomonadota bacterium]